MAKDRDDFDADPIPQDDVAPDPGDNEAAAPVDKVAPDDRSKGKWQLMVDLAVQSVPTAVGFLLGTAGIALLLFIFFGLRDAEMVELLSEAAHARGLITFIFAVGTIGIAVILTLAVVLGGEEDHNKRFTRAKEVLTILIGVLGTIVGFYFGASEDNPAQPRLDLTEPLVSESAPEATQMEIISRINNGSPPFSYEISFEDLDIPPIVVAGTDERWIRKSITLPDVARSTKASLEIEAEDTEGATGSARGTFSVEDAG